MAAQLFNNQLSQFKIKLDKDSLDYIGGMLGDMALTDHDEVRESTETFLIDANINDKARSDFYKALFSNEVFQDKTINSRTVGGAVLINSNNNKDSTIEKELKEGDNNEEEKEVGKQSATRKRVTGAKRVGKRGVRGKQVAATASSSEDDEPNLVAISQQSRFHTETLETSNKEIDLPGVQISVNQLDLLVDAHLKLKPLTRYGLVGQNGVGKSVLMKCLADNILVGLPQNLNILHISQLEDFDENTTVVQEVLSADAKATIAVREYDVLRAVIGDSAPTNTKSSKANQELNSVVFSIMQCRVKDRLDAANRLAIKRSGLRGREARRELVKIEKEYADFCKQDPQKYVTADMVNEVIAQVFERVALVEQDERKNRAQRLLKGLGFSEAQSVSLISTFSGGWRMRIALAKSLFMQPDILLLDEPTNHLDLPAILWLQEYIINDTSEMIVVVVSHDRDFLNNVTDETIIMKDKQLKYHAGNYQDWEANTEEQRIRKQALLDNTEKKRKKIQASIEHNLQTAKSTGDDKRHGMIKSRQKKIERLGMEKTEDGKRFKQSYRAGYHSSMRVEIVVEQGVKTASIKIPQPSQLRYNGPVFRMSEASFKYKGSSKNVIEKFSINIEPNARIAFIGPNGCGKSTLLNMLTGKTQPSQGEVYRHALLKVGYFSQHVVDQLDLDLSPVECMMKQYPGLSEHECRAHFGTIGISGNIVLRKIRSLSGGQRNRIAFAMILYEKPHVLVLDEITNHLDMGTVEMLVDALADFSGALIVVSHDVWFLKQILDPETDESESDQEDELIQREVYSIKQGVVKKWEKGIDAYVASVLRTVKKQNNML
ncbi:P-loop containing nucleoside triphosphate hydrolase protein [Parasitella parasitica]|nr:P-loop containing nucleoside triphosphate hydrolase protein [Parasitella parasitica]